MAENEDAFAIEAQDHALLLRSQELHQGRSGSPPLTDEESPLLSRKLLSIRAIPPTAPRDLSLARTNAFTKPWTTFEGLPWYRRPSIYWLLPALFPFCLSFGGLIVPKTYFVLNLLCRDYLCAKAATDPSSQILPILLGEQNAQCRSAQVQSLVARFQLYSSLLSGIFAAAVTPYLGALSDRVGRKKIIVFSSLGLLAEGLVTILVGTYPETLSVYWLLAGYLLDGLCGSFTAGMAVTLAYASDCTAPERRNVAIGLYHGTLFAGIAIGPILAGLLMKWTGTILITFYSALGCQLFFVFFVLAFIPESVSKERQAHAREKHQSRKQETRDETWWSTIKAYNLFEPLWILRPRGPGTSSALRRNLCLLASIDTIMFGVAMGTMGIILIYPQYVFGWDPVQASTFLSIANICRVTGLFVVLPLVIRIFRSPVGSIRTAVHKGADILDIRIIRVAILLDLVGYVGYATAMTGSMMVTSAMIAAFAGIGSPTLSAAITAHVPPDRTGQVLGAMGLLHALARVISPTIFNTIYSLTVGKFPAAVFVCLGSLFLVVFILSWFLKPGVSYDTDLVVSPAGTPAVEEESSALPSGERQ